MTWRASLTTTGGITGGGAGVVIRSDGSIYSAEFLMAGSTPEITYLGWLASSTVENLEGLLGELQDVEYRKNANMLTRLRWRVDDSATQEWSWELMDPHIPPQLGAVQKALDNLSDHLLAEAAEREGNKKESPIIPGWEELAP